MSYYVDKEQQEKEIYERAYTKVVTNSNKVVFIIFLIMGLFFMGIGLSLFFFGVDEEDKSVGIVFTCMGLLFIVLGFVMKLSSNIKPDYEKFLKRSNKYINYSSYDLAIKLEMLEEKNKLLEERIEELERRR